MAENRCQRCNRELMDPSAVYGWRCAKRLEIPLSGLPGATRAHFFQSADKAIKELTSMGLDWADDDNLKLLIQILFQHFTGTMEIEEGDLETLKEKLQVALRMRKVDYFLEVAHEDSYPDDSVMRDIFEQFGMEMPSFLESLDECILTYEEKERIAWYWGMIEDGGKSDGELHSASMVEKLARVIYKEQMNAPSNQDEIFWVLFNRLFTCDNYTYSKYANMDNILLYGNFSTYPGHESPPADAQAWHNAKLLATYAYALFSVDANNDGLPRPLNRDDMLSYFQLVTEDDEATIYDMFSYYQRKVSMLPDVKGIPLGVYYHKHMKFRGGDDAKKVTYAGSAKKENAMIDDPEYEFRLHPQTR